MSVWDTPPTAEEMGAPRPSRQKRTMAKGGSVWSLPPTKEEISQASAGADFEELAPKVSAQEHLVNRLSDTVPLARPVTNILSTAVMQAAKAKGIGYPTAIIPEAAQKEMAERGIPVPVMRGQIGEPLESYRDVRDAREVLMDEGAKQNPVADILGLIGGLGLSVGAPTPTVSVGTGPGGRLASGTLSGAAYGGLMSGTHGRADLTKGEVGKFAAEVVGVPQLKRALEAAKRGEYGDAALEALGAGVLGGGVGGAVISGGIEAAKRPLESALRNLSRWSGRRVLQGGSDVMTASRQPLSGEAIDRVNEEGLMKPGANTKGTYLRLDKLTEERAKAHGKIIDGLEDQGVEGSLAHDIEDRLIDKSVASRFTSGSDKSAADRLLAEADAATENALGRKRLGLRQQEAIKSDLQTKARYERLKHSGVEEAIGDAAGVYREAGEEAVENAARAAGPGTEIDRLAKQFKPSKEALSELYEARDFAERGAVKAAGRNSVGLPDFIVGSTMGDPASAYAAAMGSSIVRNRVPSALSYSAYELGPRGLNSGATQSHAARLLESYMSADGAEEMTKEEKQKALIEYLRSHRGQREPFF